MELLYAKTVMLAVSVVVALVFFTLARHCYNIAIYAKTQRRLLWGILFWLFLALTVLDLGWLILASECMLHRNVSCIAPFF